MVDFGRLVRAAAVQLETVRLVAETRALSHPYPSEEYQRWQVASDRLTAIVSATKGVGEYADREGLRV